MRFAQAQVREALQLSQETVRHWRKVLAPLRARAGHSAVFTFGDLVALAVVRTLIQDLGMSIGWFETHAEILFDLCNHSLWSQLEDCVAVVHIEGVELVKSTAVRAHRRQAIAMVPIGPLVANLRSVLLGGRETESQQQLRFPPSAVSSNRASSR
jgi:hypothetical protein